jgi:hypothetical protein
MPLDASNQGPDQSVSAKKEFNAKTVKLSEFKAEYKKLVKATFTFKEKVQLTACKPLDIIIGVRLGLKVFKEGSLEQKELRAQSPDGSLGMYKDNQKNRYMNGAMANLILKTTFNETSQADFRVKSLAASYKAFVDCKDFQHQPNLRPF